MAKAPDSSGPFSARCAGPAEPPEVKRGPLQILTGGEMTQGKKMEDAAQKASLEKKKKNNPQWLVNRRKRKGDQT